MSKGGGEYAGRFGSIFLFIFLMISWSSSGYPGPQVTSTQLRGLKWRPIGPAVFGGRVTDVAGVEGDPNLIYVAHASAGLFKSTNGGITFESIFDMGNTQSIGGFAPVPGNPDVIYVGTGEGKVRNSVSFGDGIYKSLDGGRTWEHLGLAETERFSRIIVHPRDSKTVFAAAMGHLWGPNLERGVFRSHDGGVTWEKVLYVNETTGASDICFDSENPEIIYAGMYDYLRRPWHFRSGGPGSGLYRSSDGGTTWMKLTDPTLDNGLPGAGLIGRIGVAAAMSDPHVVYALIECEEEGMLWRSHDRGISWEMVNNSSVINPRPFYFTRIFVDPADENRIYALGFDLYASSDGGRTFEDIGPYWKLFGDHHALWIDPENPSRILNGSDGGFHISNDRAESWDFVSILPFAQAYHVAVDMAEPYHVIGGFQDHEIWRGPNEKWNRIGVRNSDWFRVRDHGDGLSVVVDPRDPNIIYYNCENGDLFRVDLRTGEERYIQPYPVISPKQGASAHPYRFNWNAPIYMSPSDPDVIYFGGNVLFKTIDEGYSWSIISPDLTTNDSSKMGLSGGPITIDNTGAEIFCTILSIAESPFDREVIWAGTDDGCLQLTRNGGDTWTNMAPYMQGLPEMAWISSIVASPHHPEIVYISVDQHRLDDFTPYVFVTRDLGKSWESIAAGLRGYVHVIREDPREPGLLYAGTESGIFISFDRGKQWRDLRLGLPALPVYDVKVHPRDNDLIIATHARGFYILDDITPLQELDGVIEKKAFLFKPSTATRFTPMSDVSSLGGRAYVAKNQPYGAIISFYLGNQTEEAHEVKFDIFDSHGACVRKLKGKAHQGVNRVVWDLCEDPRIWFKNDEDLWSNPPSYAPKVLPGVYRVSMRFMEEYHQQSISVRLDPRLSVSREGLEEYHQALTRLVRMRYLADETGDSSPSAALADLTVKITALLEQIRNFTGSPTAAQKEWIEALEQDLNTLLDKRSTF
jgi:photosystem II stability/assembly factor-like uncharacterized protein